MGEVLSLAEYKKSHSRTRLGSADKCLSCAMCQASPGLECMLAMRLLTLKAAYWWALLGTNALSAGHAMLWPKSKP